MSIIHYPPVNRSLTLGNIVIEQHTGTAKLSNFALFYLTCQGKYVDYFVGEPAFSAPEVGISSFDFNTSKLCVNSGSIKLGGIKFSSSLPSAGLG